MRKIKVSIQDEESWFEAIKSSIYIKGGAAGSWRLEMSDGTEVKFRGLQGFLKQLKNDSFRERVYDIMDQVLIFRNSKYLVEDKKEENGENIKEDEEIPGDS